MTLPLKTTGRKPVSKPWDGDALGREPYAKAMTNLLDGQTEPLVISINGSWGTGKTFFLQHWQAQLEQSGYKAIYFNAWEDDHCGDPLVAIIGQLWESLKGSDLQEIGNSIKEAAKPLFVKTIFNTLRAKTAGMIDFDDAILKSIAETAGDDYAAQRLYRDELKRRLVNMAGKVCISTKYPMVFIIDELDRCRPTFAIELLERVKHIFDIPNMVFVLGIDRSQLGNSIHAVYGDIDVDGYLRRFIDMEFVLQQGNLKPFVQHLMKLHGLDGHFNALSERAKYPEHKQEFYRYQDFFAGLSQYLGLSPRDVEYATRSFVLVAKNLKDRSRLFPELLTILILLRVKNPELYRQYVSQPFVPANVLDWFLSWIPEQYPESSKREIDRLIRDLEYIIYMAAGSEYEDPIQRQLDQLLKDRSSKTTGLSKRTRSLPDGDLKEFADIYHATRRSNSFQHDYGTKDAVEHLASMIELTSCMLDNGGRR